MKAGLYAQAGPSHPRKSCVLYETVLQSELGRGAQSEGLETCRGGLLELSVSI